MICWQLPWRNFTKPAWVAQIFAPPVLLYHLHMCQWCLVNYCLITKCPPLFLLHPLPLSLSQSPTTPEGNSGTPVCNWFWCLTLALHMHFLLFSYKTWLVIHFILFLTQSDFCCMSFFSSLVWTAAQDSPFSVSPSSCDLAPLKSTSFRVTYDPKQLNTLHGAQLECFAYHRVMFIIYSKKMIKIKWWTIAFLNKFLKNTSFKILQWHICLKSLLRDEIISCILICCHSVLLFFWLLQYNHHINEGQPCSPWCVTVRVIGHSFQPGKEHFNPCSSLRPPRVVSHKAQEREQISQYVLLSLSVFICVLKSFIFSLFLPFFQ